MPALRRPRFFTVLSCDCVLQPAPMQLIESRFVGRNLYQCRNCDRRVIGCTKCQVATSPQLAHYHVHARNGSGVHPIARQGRCRVCSPSRLYAGVVRPCGRAWRVSTRIERIASAFGAMIRNQTRLCGKHGERDGISALSRFVLLTVAVVGV